MLVWVLCQRWDLIVKVVLLGDLAFSSVHTEMYRPVGITLLSRHLYLSLEFLSRGISADRVSTSLFSLLALGVNCGRNPLI